MISPVHLPLKIRHHIEDYLRGGKKRPRETVRGRESKKAAAKDGTAGRAAGGGASL